MKKTITLLLTAIMLVFALTGCVRTDIGVTLNKNGTGSVSASFGIEKSVYDQLTALGGSDLFDGKTPEAVKYGDTTYMTVTETKEYGSYEEIKEALLEMTYDTDKLDSFTGDDKQEDNPSDYTLYQPETEKKTVKVFDSVNLEKTEGIFYSVYTFRATVNPPEVNNDQLKGSYKMTITVNMPDTITQSKGGTVDGKTIVFDFDDLTEVSEIAAVSEVNNYGVIIGICAALLVAAVVFVIVIKRKK